MKLLTTLYLLSFATACFAQRQNVYFLKNDGRYVQTRDSADYLRIVREPDSASVLYNVFEFYLNGEKKLIGKSKTIDPPKYDGICRRYYKGGQKQAISNYENGLLTGECYEYYPNGKIYLIKNYSEKNDFFKDLLFDYLITAAYDSSGTPMVQDGNGYCKLYDNNFISTVDEGNVKNGKRDGEWKGYDPHLKLNFHELYENGTLISGVSISANGDSVEYKKSRSTPPDYDGGIAGFGKYLSRNIVYPDYEKIHRIQGKVILSFVVEQDGSISGIRILHSVSDNIDKEAIRVVQKAPGWKPGKEYGRNIRVVFTQPINFTTD